jgi:hydroxypyruvate reductase
VLLCGGTDGIDGPTDAAGGWATPSVDARGREMGLEARSHLERNDALSYLTEVGALLVTGPTHTNVMDLHVGVVLP